jgi:hypothetical protein
MCYIDGEKNKYSVLNECNRMLKYNEVIEYFSIYLILPAAYAYRLLGESQREGGH